MLQSVVVRDRSSAADADNRISSASAICGAVTVVVYLLQLAGTGIVPWMTCMPLLAFVLYSINARQGLWDHVTIACLGLLFYSLIPLATMEENGLLFLGFHYRGAYYITTTAICVALFSISIASRVVKASSTQPEPPTREREALFRVAASIAGVLSVVLSLIYVSQHGAVLLGDYNYSSGFLLRREAGSGFLLLSVPLAIACQALVLAGLSRPSWRSLALSLLPYVLLYVTHGHRRFLIVPVLLLAAKYLTVRKMSTLLVLFGGIIIMMLLFYYLGYLRLIQVPLSESLSASAREGFWRNSRFFLGGEAVPVYATASASYLHLLAPLPFFGDYLASPLIMMPQFLFGNIFTAANDRFALVVTRAAAVRGIGWGFSYFGEGYMVFGYVGVVLTTIFAFFSLRLFTVWSSRGRFTGLGGAFGLALLQMSFWFQRNAFAYNVREVVFQVIVVAGCMWMAALVVSRPRRPAAEASVRYKGTKAGPA